MKQFLFFLFLQILTSLYAQQNLSDWKQLALPDTVGSWILPAEGKLPVTMCRLNLIKGLGPVLQISEGWTATFPAHVFDIINQRTDKTWPSTFFVPRITGKGRFTDIYSVMNYWGANHGAISYGHIGADLITLASALSIPVNMHNVDDEKIFRPDAWSAFGSDNEGADYRACQTYGPLYK